MSNTTQPLVRASTLIGIFVASMALMGSAILATPARADVVIDPGTITFFGSDPASQPPSQPGAQPGQPATGQPSSPGGPTTFRSFVNKLLSTGNFIIVPALFTFASFTFLWGIFQYFILGGANDEKRAQGRMFALWGLLALALMFSAWGLVRVFMTTFGL